MIRSMTGYGRAAHQYGEITVHVEIKTLNSKYTDISLRYPPLLRSHEPALRQHCTTALQRGKIDCIISLEGLDVPTQHINTKLVEAYLAQLAPLADRQQQPTDLLGHVLRIPDVIVPTEEEADPGLLAAVEAALKQALAEVNHFRDREGQILEKDFSSNLHAILSHLEKVAEHEPARKEQMRHRLLEQLEQWVPGGKVDQNRYEEELIYYLEKLDINEEKVRLRTHCQYFLEVLAEEGYQKGKKLNFLGQEIGREINTIGSKAQYAPIQQLVVQMKDHLEQIKEQVLNVV